MRIVNTTQIGLEEIDKNIVISDIDVIVQVAIISQAKSLKRIADELEKMNNLHVKTHPVLSADDGEWHVKEIVKDAHP